MRTLRFLSIGRRIYSVGFLWRHRARVSHDAIYDVSLVSGKQVGLACTDGRLRARSLADSLRRGRHLRGKCALLLLALKDSEGQAFWWLYAQDRDGLVAGFADSLYATDKEGALAFFSAKAFLERKGSPPEIELRTESFEESVRSLMRLTRLSPCAYCLNWLLGAGLPVQGPLRKHRERPGRRRTLGLILLIGLVFAGYAFFSDVPEEVMRPNPDRPNPEVLVPPARAVDTEALIAHLRTLPLSVNGWTLERILFADSELSVRYARTKRSVYQGLPADCVPSLDGRFIERRTRLALPERSLSEDSLCPWLDIQGKVLDCAAHLGCTGTLTAQKQGSLAPFRVGTFRVQAICDRHIGALLEGLQSLPGVRLARLTFARGQWAIEATVYGK
ncbi:MAG: hypothetical protein IJU76_15225 [Desulfovibrionaceae bacterium]|nr:hypothetical protein [Desulfovibrionaceae bacterium]